MAITHTATARNAMVDALTALCDGGTIEILDSGDVVLATLTLGSPAFAAADNGVATLNAVTGAAAAADGTIAKFQVKGSGGDVIFSGTAGGPSSGADAEFDAATTTTGQEINLTGGSYTGPV